MHQVSESSVEREGQIQWFTDLREAIEADDKESALEAVDAAIGLLERRPTDRRADQNG